MFIYLSKKIAIPNQTKINALAWNQQDGYIAVGGHDGLLKVLKLETADEEKDKRSKRLTAVNNLSLNQTLEGHNGSVRVLVWNEQYRKLTTSDENGVIIVWMMYKGSWYEEMINNRKKSTVVGMAWSSDGLKICIVYEDGAVIVGSVDGNRIWGRELKDVQLTGVQWSPDNKLILFSLKNGELHMHDNQGNFVMKLETKLNQLMTEDEEIPAVVAIDWYNGKHGSMHALSPNLAICYENGYTQIMNIGSDMSALLFNTEMFLVNCGWNMNGSLLAITGRQDLKDRSMNIVQFYSVFGQHLRTLKVPGLSISCCVWETGSLRVALAVDSFIYFANVCQDYKWCYIKNTIAYTSSRTQEPGMSVFFWDTVNDQCYTRKIPVFLAMAGYGDYCVLSTMSDNMDESGFTYDLTVCNTIGTPVDTKNVKFETTFVSMSSMLVVAASRHNFLVWHFRTPKLASIEGGRLKTRIYHVDDSPLGTLDILQDLDEKFPTVSTHESADPISCIACSLKCLLIGRESGIVQYYALPHVVLSLRINIGYRIHKMEINCNCSRASIIDIVGVMTVVDISEGGGRIGRPPSGTEATRFERKDVWDMRWALDNPQLLAIMEKTRMYIFKGAFPEEPIASSGYIYNFNDLEVQSILLDEIMESPDKPSKNSLLKVEIKSLRDTRALLEKVGLEEADLFIEDNQHPRLWRLLAESALKAHNLEVAETAFIRSRDYSRVKFVKKMKEENSPAMWEGRIAIYFKKFDEAEKIFTDADRSDLALQLRQTLGDWFRVIHILRNGVTASDKVLKNAYNSAADYFKEFNNWSAAVEYYELANNQAEAIECYFYMENYEKLAKYIDILPESDPLLEKIGDMFASLAVHTEAVKAYIKFGDLKAAIDVCVLYNIWDKAIDIAKTHSIPGIAGYFMKYTHHLVDQDKLFEAIDVNVQAKFYLQAAIQAFKLATKVSKDNLHASLLLKKKHFVYAAKLLELHKRHPNSEEFPSLTSEIYFNQWRGAEAFHFFMLAQAQLYDGKLHDSLCTLYRLQDYDDFISTIDIYSLYALSACLNRAFGLCSRAFMKLQLGEGMSRGKCGRYKKLAVEIFLKNEPTDLRILKATCFKCKENIPDWLTVCPICGEKFVSCIVSGKPIIDRGQTWVCEECDHHCLAHLILMSRFCPLCHYPIN